MTKQPALASAQPLPARPGENRRFLALGTAIAVVAAVMLLSIAFGAVRLGLSQVIDGLLNRGDNFADEIVRNIRLPRALVAVAAGASLALAGSLLQTVSRNPLADPQVLGFSAAGALAVVVVVVRYPGIPTTALPPIAIGGALAGAAIVYAVAWSGGASPVRLALAGVMLASLFTSFTALALVTSELTTQAALSWVAGGLFGRGWEHAGAIWPYLAAGALGSVLLIRSLNVLSLGDDHARSLGLPVERTRIAATVSAAILTGGAVAAGGQIAFVGLVSPHLARMIVGSDHRFTLPMAALIGAALLGGSDIVARVILAPVEIPVGVVTSAVGVPFFIFLLKTRT